MIQKIVEVIQQAGVQFKLKNGQLYVHGSQSYIDPETLDIIRKNKAELTEWLKASDASNLLPQKLKSDVKSHPLSSAQKRLWFTHELEGTSAQYNMIYAWKLEGDLDVDRLNQSIQNVVTQHPMLRTVFKEEDGLPRQVILDSYKFSLCIIDCQNTTNANYYSLCEERLRSEGDVSFDLSSGLMIQGTLIRKSQTYSVLMLTIHHIAADGWSEGIIKKAISDYYNYPDKVPSIADLNWSYTDYVHHQSKLIYTKELDYWKQQLAQLDPEFGLPTDKIRPNEQVFRGAILRTHIAKATYQSASSVFREQGATPYAGLYTCFSVLIRHVTKSDDIVMGTPVAGREQLEFSDVVGFFVNTLVLKTQLNQDDSLVSAINKCKMTVLDALSHQRLPFDTLVEAVQPSRTLDRHPLFQIMFAFQTNDHGSLSLDQIQISDIEEVCPKVIFDLQLDILENERGLELEWRYNTDLFEEESIAKLAGSFETVLLKVAEIKDVPLSQLPLEAQIEDWSDRIQRVLESHDSVEQAVVGLRLVNGEEQVVACIVPKDAQITTDSDQVMSEWSSLFDDVYKKGDGSEFDIIGWNSSYTGHLIPQYEMTEWLDKTIDRIQSFSPKKIFEIGTGTGLLLYRLIEQCESYVGIDPSSTIIARHYDKFQKQGIDNATVYQGSAHEINDLALADIDTVLINSVAQYFPNIEYLSTVIKDVLGTMTSGTIFIGDVCDYRLQDEFYLSLERYQYPEQFKSSSAECLTALLDNKRAVERELMISPEFFVYLKQHYPAITGVDILPKRGDFGNEMSRFRYDVVLLVGKSVTTGVLPATEWSEEWELTQGLSDFVLTGYPNKRAFIEAEVVKALCDETFDLLCVERAVKQASNLMSLEELHQQAAMHSYCLSVQLNVEPAHASRSYDLIFTQLPLPLGGYSHQLSSEFESRDHSTQPSNESLFLDFDSSELEQFSLTYLPSELQPNHYIFVSDLPLSSLKKMDWESVLSSYNCLDDSDSSMSEDIKPVLSQHWQEVLRLDTAIGFDDNFFDLGGHSLLATRLVSVLSKQFAIALTVRDIFVAQTVRELAALVQLKRQEHNDAQTLVSSEDELAGGITL